MKIAFRADSSLQIGMGHIMRCRALAYAMRARGAEVSFICRAHQGHVAGLLAQDGYRVHMLSAPPDDASASDDLYARWLGVSEDQDAAETRAVLAGGTDVLVVDHYGLSSRWEEHLRPACGKILAIDDLARPHAADALLDQNYALDPASRYAGRVPENCTLLLGPRFALLSPDYADLAAAPVTRRAPVRRVLVFFGGADPDDVTGRVVRALSDGAFGDLQLDIVVGAANPHAETLARAAATRPHTTLHKNLPSLAPLMAEADLALGAGGGATWERCAFGLPSIVISIAANQVPASEALNASGVIHYLGAHDAVSAEALRGAVKALIDAPEQREAMSAQSRLLVDGRGAARVSEAVMPTPREALTLRRADARDCAFYFRLANDPDVRRQSFSSDIITWDGHQRWYHAKVQDAASRLYVLEAHGLPVGQIRFDTREGKACIGYALDPIARGRSWGAHLVTLGLRRLAADAPGDVLAEVRLENPASRAVFDKLGFTPELSPDRSRHYLSRAQLLAGFSGSQSLKEI